MKFLASFLLCSSCFGAVTVEWVSPTNGAVVKPPVTLTVNAGSDASEIGHVDFYRDGIFLATALGKLRAPTLDQVK